MFKRIAVGAAIAGVGWATYFSVRRWWATWGVTAAEQAMSLPGDEIVPDGANLLTRGITIEASPEVVWPWLVQMGYGRAGWYSYDQLDMKGRSAEAILPGFQSIAVGDVMPTNPGGGFEVRVVEPNRAFVLYLDDALVRAQADLMPDPISAADTPGLAASGRFLASASPPTFAVSWAFVLEPLGVGRTRLIERTRGRFGRSAGSVVGLPLMGFGVFVMMRKQMLGIRDRVESAAGVEEVRQTTPAETTMNGQGAETNVPAAQLMPVIQA
jgi:hypothetical protein